MFPESCICTSAAIRSISYLRSVGSEEESFAGVAASIGDDKVITRIKMVAKCTYSSTLSTYRHLADGTKYMTVSAGNNGAILYRGPLTFTIADVTATTPAISFLRAETGSAGAAIIASATGSGATPYFYVTDQLGSVRAVVDGQGSVVERNDYYTYGKRHTTGRTYADLKNSPLLFSGKEDQGQALDLASGTTTPSNLRILDFGARHYDPVVPRWTTPDPLAEKYLPVNYYGYCMGNPVNVRDYSGRDTVLVLDKASRPLDNGTKGTSYSADIYYVSNGMSSVGYRGSSYPNSISNSNNSTSYNTVNEGEYIYNNKYGHKHGTKKGLNIVDADGNRRATATSPKGKEVIATYINVHSGASDNGNYNSRGSQGCITVHPDDASDFFDNFNWTNPTKTTGDSHGILIISRDEENYTRLKKEIGIIPKTFFNRFFDYVNSILSGKWTDRK